MRTARGYSLIEVIVAIGIGLSLLAAIGVFLANGARFHSQLLAIAEVGFLRQRIVEALASDEAWQKTLDSSLNVAAVACLKSESACSPNGSGAPFAIYDSDGSLIFDATNPAHGFTDNGRPCNTFSVRGGTGSCTNRFDLRWTRSCTPGNCVDALTKISAVFQASWDGERSFINPNRLSLLNYYRESIQVIPPAPPIPAARPPPPALPTGSCWSSVFTTTACAGNWIYDNHMATGCSWTACGVSYPPQSACSSGNIMRSASCSGSCCTFNYQNCSPASCP